MNKKRKGYTLAELLVTLGIVSVVAALAIPSFVNNVNKQAIIPGRDRAVNLLEEGMANLIYRAQNNSSTEGAVTMLSAISTTDINSNAVRTIYVQNGGTALTEARECQSLIGIEPISDANRNAYINSANMLQNNNQVRISTRYPRFNNSRIYRLKKNNSYIIVEPFVSAASNNNLADPNAVIARIYIDPNGQKGRNRLDEDLFVYGLGNNGHIYKEDVIECTQFDGGCKR